MQTNSLFVDTSGWMAHLSADESYHDQADDELRQASMPPHIAICTTDHVLAEGVALMTARRLARQQIVHDVGTILRSSRCVADGGRDARAGGGTCRRARD